MMRRYLVHVSKEEKEFILMVDSPNKDTAVNELTNLGWGIMKIIEESKAHLCKYCGEIVEGTDSDILCDDCRELFGHVFYSEL